MIEFISPANYQDPNTKVRLDGKIVGEIRYVPGKFPVSSWW